MPSKVYAITMRASDKESLPQKIGRLMDVLDLKKGIRKRDLTAVKIHFGEKGNTSFIRPVLVRPVLDKIKEAGGLPFLTDANTLYVGRRSNAVEHFTTAVENGFSFSVVGAPVIIADGLKGSNAAEIELGGRHIQTAYIGREVADADVFVSLAHWKLHELSGFGGAIKNTGMGAAARRGKMEQHGDIRPKIKQKKCIGCGICLDHCAHDAITLEEVDVEDEKKKKARIDHDLCVGCAECIRVCPEGAPQIPFSKDIPVFQKKMVEYTAAALKGKEGRQFFVNYLTQIVPACDCHPHSDAPIVRDIGIAASTDPVALDQASVDLMNAQPALTGSCMTCGFDAGEDKIRSIYDYIDWVVQLDYAEEIGLGVKAYDLEWLPENLPEKK